MSYQTRNWLIIAATLALNIGSAFAIDHAHDLEGHGATTLTLNNGTKWPIDAPLRQGMKSIKAELLPQLPAIHENRLKDSTSVSYTHQNVNKRQEINRPVKAPYVCYLTIYRQ